MNNVQKIEIGKVLENGSAKLVAIDLVSVPVDRHDPDGERVSKVVLDIEGLVDSIFLTLPQMLKAFGIMAKGVLTQEHVQLLAFYDVNVNWSQSRLCEIGTKYSPWIKDEFSEDFTPVDGEDFVDLHGVSIKFISPDAGLMSMLKTANSTTDTVLYDREAEREERQAKRPAKRLTSENLDEVVVDEAIAGSTDNAVETK